MAEEPTENEGTEEGVESASSSDDYTPDEFDDGAPATGEGADINLEVLLDVPVSIALHVGTTTISIRDLMNLVEGSVVELDRASSDPMDVLVNGTLVARGEIVVVNDSFGVRLTEVVTPAERLRKLN